MDLDAAFAELSKLQDEDSLAYAEFLHLGELPQTDETIARRAALQVRREGVRAAYRRLRHAIEPAVRARRLPELIREWRGAVAELDALIGDADEYATIAERESAFRSLAIELAVTWDSFRFGAESLAAWRPPAETI